MNLEKKNQVRNLFKPTITVLKHTSKGPFKKVKNTFLKHVFVHKTPFGYRAVIGFDHRYFDVDATISSDGTVGYHLSFVPKPHAKTETAKGGEHTLMIEFKLPKGKKFQILKPKNKDELEVFFLPEKDYRYSEWQIYSNLK